MSGRMRTGQVTAGPSREAAYGVALSQEVKVTDRPVTQQVRSRAGAVCVFFTTVDPEFCTHFFYITTVIQSYLIYIASV